MARRAGLIIILLGAFALRVLGLDTIPAGLSHDEAYNGVTALQILNGGEYRIFFEINKGIEPLIIYLEAIAFHFFGVGPVQLRLVNVSAGMLTVALVYPVAARWFDRRVALWAMAGVAISFWAVFVSRLTLRAVLLPPLLLLTLYFIQVAVAAPTQRRALLCFALSGLAGGASMYTYLSSRFVPILIVAWVGYHWLRTRRQHWGGLAVWLIIWAAMFTPLVMYYVENQASFSERANQVTNLPHLLAGNPWPMLEETGRTLGMFILAGDETDRYNLNGRPVFDPINGAVFSLGVLWLLWRLFQSPDRAWPAAGLLIWGVVMLTPDFITDDSPHFLRTIGALPTIYVIWACGLVLLADGLARLRMPAIAHTALLALIVAGMTAHTSYDYFYRWANAAEGRHIYGADIAAVAEYVKENQAEGLMALSAEYYRDLDPFRFALHFGGDPPFVLWFDGGQSLAFPPPESGLSPQYVFAASRPPSEFWADILTPAVSHRAYAVYTLPSNVAERYQTFFNADPLHIALNNDLLLNHYRIFGTLESGGQLKIVLGWQALRGLPPGTDYTFLVQLRDAQGHLWAQADGSGYDPMNWQPGVVGLQYLKLNLPTDLPRRQYNLTAQVVNRQTGQSLPTEAGQSVIRLETITAQLPPHPEMPDRLPNFNPGDTSGFLALRGYRVTPTPETLAIQLHWEVLQPIPRDVALEFFLIGANNQTLYPWPALPPMGGEWPTSQWPVGYWVQDRLDLPRLADIPVGRWRLWIRVSPDESFELDTIVIEDKLHGSHN